MNLELARKNLNTAWNKIEDVDVKAPPRFVAMIEEILHGQVTYKYILITGLLGKLTDPDVHPRALQAGSSLPGAYDARSLCHQVIVTFEKTKGNLFGLSNEPFLNKPARHPEHDKTNTQLKSKRLASLTHDVLEKALSSDAETVESMLVTCLRIGKSQADSEKQVLIDVDVNHQRVLTFVEDFLVETSGGARLVAVTGAFVSLLSPQHTVKVYNPNASDKFAKTGGDVEVFNDAGELISAYECKHRPMNIDDVRHGIKKARDNQIPEYIFVTADGLASGQKPDIEKELTKTSTEIDVALFRIRKAAPYWSAMLNPERRALFGETVVALLRNSMKRRDVGNEAAELWNSLE